MKTFRELLQDGRVHVFDGAMGTVLYGRGVFLNVCYDELSLRQPDLIRDIHREYVKAGAEVLETNTFGANPFKLAHYGLSDETQRLNSPAVTRCVSRTRYCAVMPLNNTAAAPSSETPAGSLISRDADTLR